MGARRPSLKVRTRRAVAACAAAGVMVSGHAAAQSSVREFDIPSQDAAAALQDFARQAGVQLLFPYEAAAGRRAPAVRGRHRDRDALEMMAAAAGLSVLSYSGSTVVLGVAPAPLEIAPEPPAPPSDVGALVITGTNIRAPAPLGLHVQQLERRQIEESAAGSVQEFLAGAAPQLTGFGSAGQGAGSFEPRLRSLGGSSSASTLVLVDGHRITPGGGVANTSDPNVIPMAAVERIDILSDGASALYGSEAVAGVINIITRKRFDGIEVGVRSGLGRDYGLGGVDLTYGRSDGARSVLATYSFTRRSALFAGDRDFVSGNQSDEGPGATGRGGANFNTYACAPATIIPAAGQPGAGEVFLHPYLGAGLANAPTRNGQCSTARYRDLLPSETAHRFFFAARQGFGDSVRLSWDMVYSRRATRTRIPRGAVSNVAVFGPGASESAQINPFFTGPPGVSRGSVAFDFETMFGPGAASRSTQESLHSALSVDVSLPRDWMGSLTLVAGRPTFTTRTEGVICLPCAYTALNGTPTAAGLPGGLAAANILGDEVSVVRPLTTANALDVWTAAGSRTSTAVRDQLLDTRTFSQEERPVIDLTVKLDGPVARLPAGDVRMAVGAEYFRLGRRFTTTGAGAVGPSSTNATLADVAFDARNVASAFAEILAPLVAPEMGVPLMRRLELDLSARIDHYSDIIEGAATTRNPKLSLGWEPTRGLTLRTSYGTSFTAPQVGHNQPIGGSENNFRDYFATGGAAFQLPAGYPKADRLGCPTATTCTISPSSGVDGIVAYGANPSLKPQTGRTWSVGFDVAEDRLVPGLRASVTYWRASYRGLITNLLSITQAGLTPGISDVFIIDPTTEEIARYTAGRTQASPLPTPVRFLYNRTQSNLFNLRAQGVDLEARYARPTPVGLFSLDFTGALKVAFERQTGEGPWLQVLDIGNSANTISPLKFAGRLEARWSSGPWAAGLGANYVGDYYLTDSTLPFANRPCPTNVTATGFGCQEVGSNLTFDLDLQLRLGRRFGAPRLQLRVENLLDADPPWINSADTITAGSSLNTWNNPIGRVVTVGLSGRW